MYDEISWQLNAGTQDFQRITPFLIGLGIVFLLISVLSSVGHLVDQAQQLKIKDHLAEVIQTKMQNLDMSHLEDPELHDIYFLIEKEAINRPASLILDLRNMLQNAISFMLIAAFLSQIDWSIGLVLIISVVPGTVIQVIYSEKLNTWRRSSTSLERKGEYLHHILTNPRFAKENRTFSAEPSLKERFLKVRKQLFNERIQILKLSLRNTSISKVIEVGAEIVLYALVVKRTLAGFVTIGDLVVLIQAFVKGKTNLTKTLYSFVIINEHRLLLNYLKEFMAIKTNLSPKADDQGTSTQIVPALQKLVVQNVCFSYPQSNSQVLKSINITFEKGKVYAIVGKNGSGKSSLIKLISRLYKPDKGRVLWNDTDIQELPDNHTKNNISICFQDFAKYHLSVSENIRLKRENDDEQKLEFATRESTAEEVINQLPERLNQQLGKQYKKGTELSTGQWQKLAIARMLYKDADLLILDEPTSAIDPLSESIIFDSIRQQAEVKGKTIILVTHRLYNLSSVDKIIVMQDGNVIDQGSHSELMTSCRTYHKMFESQTVNTSNSKLGHG